MRSGVFGGFDPSRPESQNPSFRGDLSARSNVQVPMGMQLQENEKLKKLATQRHPSKSTFGNNMNDSSNSSPIFKHGFTSSNEKDIQTGNDISSSIVSGSDEEEVMNVDPDQEGQLD